MMRVAGSGVCRIAAAIGVAIVLKGRRKPRLP